MNTKKFLSVSAIEAKLSPPDISASEVPRHRLIELLCASRDPRLVVIRAPAGFGKTSMMLQYKRALTIMKVRTAWITLDRADNDITRLLQCVASAVAHMLHAPSSVSSDSAALLEIFAQLWQFKGPFVLFVDEYEIIQEESVQDLVRQIIEGMPRGSQVVIGSRNVPSLPLGRMRARAQLLEIDAEQLRFTLEESHEYLTVKRGLDLAPADVQRLHGKTEGWIAGLWLASAALARTGTKSDFISRFSGSNLHVADYLSEDILNLQTLEVRDFLLRTSILQTLSPQLCRALVPEVDADAVLRQLENDNILITRIAGEDRSYRYHSLFAGFLRTHLERERPDEVPLLHRKASAWFAARHRAVPAIEHALDGGDLKTALTMLASHGVSLLKAGRLQLLARWFDNIPSPDLAPHPKLRMIQAWALCFTKGPLDAMDLLQRSSLNICPDRSIQRHLLAMQVVFHSLLDQPEEAYTLGMANLPGERSSDVFADATLLSVLTDVSSAKNQPAQAQLMMDRLRALDGGKIGAINEMHSQAAEGAIALFEGRMHEATARFRIAISTTLPSDASLTGGNAWAGVLYATAIYESNDLEQAADLLRVYVPLARQVGLPDHVILGYRMLTRIAFSAGEVDRAFRLLADLESIGHERRLPRVVASARLERARLQLLQGHAQPAKDELERASDGAIWAPFAQLRLLANDVDYPELAGLRWEVLAGNPRSALPRLETEWRAAYTARRLHRALKLRLLMAVAHHQADESRLAITTLDEVLRGCQRDGFMRLIVDEGIAVGLLVQSVFERHRLGADASRNDAYIVWLQRVLQAFGPLPAIELDDSRPKPVDAYLADPLTPRELDVLRLLAEGYSNQALADKLQISLSTVRTHMRSIHSKLGVKSRLQAVSAGRGFGLIP